MNEALSLDLGFRALLWGDWPGASSVKAGGFTLASGDGVVELGLEMFDALAADEGGELQLRRLEGGHELHFGLALEVGEELGEAIFGGACFVGDGGEQDERALELAE